MWKISIKKLIVRRLGGLSIPEINVFYLINALVLALLCNSYAFAETQFFEDFKGVAVDEAIWAYPTGDASFNGRTQMRLAYPSVSNGLLHLKLDTYNPSANPAGNSFYGSEIFLRKTLERGAGLILEIRARMVKPVKGLVGGAFLYKYFSETQNHSEIDFELLTNTPDKVQTNIYANEPLGVGHPEFAGKPKFVNNQLFREDSRVVPNEPLNFHLNFYAPECNWAIACDAKLHPALTPANNKTFVFDIDWVRIISDVSPKTFTAKKGTSSTRKK
jgi:hypothetical protein